MYASLTQWVPAPRRAPEGETLFAIGDVHGYADELEAIQHRVLAEISTGTMRRSTIVYLGDYIDRGPDSARTLDLLTVNPPDDENIRRVYLTGNHDQYLLELVRPGRRPDRDFLSMWFDNGGESTLRCKAAASGGPLLFDTVAVAWCAQRSP